MVWGSNPKSGKAFKQFVPATSRRTFLKSLNFQQQREDDDLKERRGDEQQTVVDQLHEVDCESEKENSSTVIGNETIVNALGEEELEDSNADKVVVKQVVLNDSPLPVANLQEVVTAVSEDFNPIESSSQAKRNTLREKGRGPLFQEDKSRNICNGAATQRKASDTEMEGSEYDVATFDDAPCCENISDEKTCEHDDEVRVMVEHLETRVDDLQMKELELERRCLEVEEEKERRVSELSEEVKTLNETFYIKMREMQKDLLCMVEHCLNFEKENQKMRNQIKQLVEERERRMQPIQIPRKDTLHEKAIFHRQPSIEKNVSLQTPRLGSNNCRIVTVSNGSLGSTPTPSKSPPSVLDRPQMTPPSSWLRSTKFVWHHPPSAPPFMPGYPQGYRASDQSYPQLFQSQRVAHPVTVPAGHCPTMHGPTVADLEHPRGDGGD